MSAFAYTTGLRRPSINDFATIRRHRRAVVHDGVRYPDGLLVRGSSRMTSAANRSRKYGRSSRANVREPLACYEFGGIGLRFKRCPSFRSHPYFLATLSTIFVAGQLTDFRFLHLASSECGRHDAFSPHVVGTHRCVDESQRMPRSQKIGRQ